MGEENETDNREQEVLKGLLGRGGTALGIAAMAHARGHSTSDCKWSSLSREITAAAEQVLWVLEDSPDFDMVHLAVMKAMSEDKVAALPKWALPLGQDPELVTRLGDALDEALLNPAIGSGDRPLTPRLKGLAGVAVALCRNQDTLSALAEKLPKADSRVMVRMARLAGATVGPGEPSSMRARLRAMLKEQTWER